MSGKWYIVCTGTMTEVIPICDDGSGPIEDWRDCTYVYAKTKNRAKWLAYRHFCRMSCSNRLKYWEKSKWPKAIQENNWHPLHGFTAQELPCSPNEIGYYYGR